MTGVEILTNNEVVVEYVFNWTAFWIVSSVVFVIIAMIGIWSYISDECSVGIIPTLCVFGVFVGITFGGLMGHVIGKPVEYATEYKVTISDEVSMTEFYEQYEVIDQDGKIFTVREKIND